MDNDKKYYYSFSNEKLGPFSLPDLKHENIKTNALIWYDGIEDWTRADNIEEIADFLGFPPPVSLDKKLKYKRNPYHRLIFIGLTILSLLVVTILYFFYYSKLDQNDLIRSSFLWFVPLCFGIGGWVANAAKSTKPFFFAFLASGIGGLVLFLLFEVFWKYV